VGGPLSLVSVNGVSFDYAGETLLRDVSFAVERGERWGLIGRNGSGKTTLFRLVAGALDPTGGSIAREGGVRITLLDQHRVFEGAATVWDAAASPFAHLVDLERSLEEQASSLETDASQKALDRYDRELQRFDREGGHTFRARVDAVLEGLGFGASAAKSRRLDGLSGGERGRVGLARELVAPGDMVLPDEPTNHLDLETTAWLEEFLVSSGITTLVVSHDRVFLDRVTDHILHLENHTATAYDSGYAKFVRLRTESRETQQKAYEQQRRKIEAEEDYIRRNIAGQNTRQAQGRRKRLATLPRLSPPPYEAGAAMALRLNAAERGGDRVVVLRGVSLEIADRTLLRGFSAEVRRGDVVGLVGANGAGKSTLLKAIAGEVAVAGGEVVCGAGITLAHYRQDLAQVPAQKTLFAAIQDLRPSWNRGAVQSHLGRFGFPGDEALRIAGSLSGGEQARLALAMIVLSGANLLLFDEPTNHLDVESIEALEDAIDDYDGTIILVSHDRALLESLTTRTWALHDGVIEDYPGTFGEWAVAKSERDAQVAAGNALATERERDHERTEARRSHADRRLAASQRRAVRRSVEEAEARAHALEAKAADLDARLHDETLYRDGQGVAEAHRLQSELALVRAELDAALDAWAAAEDERARSDVG
jgi:ATP-binding cassette subfamily F protein 3